MTERADSPLHKLRGAVLPVPDEASERQRRERIAGRVLALSRELSQRRARQRRWALGVALAALIGGVGALLLVLRGGALFESPATSAPQTAGLRLVAGHASVRDGAGLVPLSEGAIALRAESVLVTQAEESAELRLSSNTALSVAPATEVGIAREQPAAGGFEERVRLRAGSVALKVPKLGERGKVSVETGDALVEVHGTQFSVRVVQRSPLEPFTEVQVREGRVLVRAGEQETFLGAGEHWSSRDLVSTTSAPGAREPAAKRIEPPAEVSRRAAPPRRARPLGAAVSASELAAQNRLLEAAELAQRSGMPALALQRLEALIVRYPDAELAHNARVERFRLLSRLGRRSDASAAARDYLERYPSGFARREAELLLAEPDAP